MGRSREYPAVGLAYMARILADGGFDVRVCDTNYSGEDPYRAVDTWDPDIVGINTFTFTVPEAQRLAEYSKARGKVVVVGGPHPSLEKTTFFRNIKADYLCVGEGDMAMLRLAQALQDGTDADDIPGIYSRQNPRMCSDYNVILDLDSLPFPDYRFSGLERIPEYPIITSRGCPYSCTFCSVNKILGRKWRARSPRNVIEELKRAKEAYRMDHVAFLDDDYTLKKDRSKEICRLLIEERLGITWSTPNGIRADSVDEELIRLFKESGCSYVAMGVESGDPQVFQMVRKGEKLLEIEEAVRLCGKYQLPVVGFFIVGLPGSTYDAEIRSLEFSLRLRRLGLTSAAWNMAVPYPGTEMLDWVQTHGRVLKPVDGAFPNGNFRVEPTWDTPEFPASQRKRAFVKANLTWGNYFLTQEGKFRGMMDLTSTVLRYDRRNVFTHARTLVAKTLGLERGLNINP